MKYNPFVLLSVLFCLALSVSAHAMPEGYPGSMWLQGSHDFDGYEGWGAMGNVTQGVPWFTLPGEIKTKTFASYAWRIREKNQPFYNAIGPSIGVEFTWEWINFGLQYEWQEYPALHQNFNSPAAYMNWYRKLYFLGGGSDNGTSLFGLHVLGFPTATWGRVTTDFREFSGWGTMGWVRQGIEWLRLPGDVLFTTFADYRWRLRDLRRSFYNVHGPGVGAEFSYRGYDLDVEYNWWEYPGVSVKSKTFSANIAKYFDWDLKKRD